MLRILNLPDPEQYLRAASTTVQYRCCLVPIPRPAIPMYTCHINTAGTARDSGSLGRIQTWGSPCSVTVHHRPRRRRPLFIRWAIGPTLLCCFTRGGIHARCCASNRSGRQPFHSSLFNAVRLTLSARGLALDFRIWRM